MFTPFCHRFILLLVALICPGFLYAQSQTIDSLQKLLPTLQATARIDAINALSEAFWSLRNLDSSKALAFRAAEESTACNYQLGLGEALTNLATIDYEIGNFVEMEKRSRIAISLFTKKHAEKRLARACSLLGQAIWAQSKFDPAIEVFNQAAFYFGQYKDSTALGRTFGRMALLEEERGNYELAFQYSLKALKFSQNEAYFSLGQLYADVGDYETARDYYGKINQRLKLGTYLKLGETYYLQAKYDSALYYYQLHIKESRDLPKKTLTKTYALLGGLYLKLKNYKTALSYLNISLTDFKIDNNRNWVMRVLLELGKTYKETGEVNKSISTINELLTYAEESGAKQYMRDAHYLLFQLFEDLNQENRAYLHLKRYTTLNNEIGIDLSVRKLAFYKTSYEREQAQLKITLLNQQKQLQQEELKQTAQQRQFLFIGLLAIALIGIVLIRNTLLKRREEKHLRELAETELRIQKLETKKQLGELEMQVLRTQMNPHFLFNSLNSINRFILQNNKSQASLYLTKFSRLVRMILQNSQNKLITLEQELESLKLYLSLESLRFDDHFSYTITIEEELDAEALKVPPLIIQPYVENAVWHGLMHKEEKGQMNIDVSSDKGFIYIKILDNGIGRQKSTTLQESIDETHKPMGLGITSERIALLQESVSKDSVVVINDLIDSNGTPCGTEVILQLPELYD
ncbi:tetratricopeptide repeat protein [Spirosoma sp. KCTC 42546]|uniref:histidine kinase n=1 Tax=Spirosoma sp. KCTC 42546 TaxID=2520506 RepID=UPI00115B9657|nr:histidine kinase [Spirosoma sp. KCTC 42546]QDK79869.1 tetratricopeptide repeat protein [Spirosoma sp. KCTC 42546]